MGARCWVEFLGIVDIGRFFLSFLLIILFVCAIGFLWSLGEASRASFLFLKSLFFVIHIYIIGHSQD